MPHLHQLRAVQAIIQTVVYADFSPKLRERSDRAFFFLIEKGEHAIFNASQLGHVASD